MNVLNVKNFVHGDLRQGNVLWNRQQDKVMIIDFDWAGTNGIVYYPTDMNPEIGWPEGATTNELVMLEHDNFWIKKLLE